MSDGRATPTGQTTIVVLGATGDLAQRKLVPALFNLHKKGRLAEPTRVVGFARSVASDDEFRELLWQGALTRRRASSSTLPTYRDGTRCRLSIIELHNFPDRLPHLPHQGHRQAAQRALYQSPVVYRP